MLTAHHLMQIYWTRTAWTDKGLSAVGQVADRQIDGVDGDETLILRINDQQLLSSY